MNKKMALVLCLGLLVTTGGCKKTVDNEKKQACDTGFAAYCLDNKAFTCENGFVVDKACGGNICWKGACVKACDNDTECGGLSCVANKCVEKTTVACSAEKPCSQGECLEGVCYIAPSGTQPKIQPVDQNNEPNPECNETKPCSDNKICEQGKCIEKTIKPECDAENPCADGKTCNAEGKCVANEMIECNSDKPCPEGKQCRAGQCKDPIACTNDDECPEDQYCNGNNCADIVCNNHLDCQKRANNWFCHNQKCLQAECSVENPCADTNKMCSEGLCIDKGFVACDATKPCAAGTCISGACITDAMKPFIFSVNVRNIDHPVRLSKEGGIIGELDEILSTYTNSGVIIDCGEAGERVGTEIACQYKAPGDYEIKLYGNIDAIYMCVHQQEQDYMSAHYLNEVKQWGNGQWKSLVAMFKYCPDVNITATDIPDFSAVRYANQMFMETTKTTLPANMWNNTTSVDMTELFSGAKNISDTIKDWDTSHVNSLREMFIGCSEMNIDLSKWNTANVTNMDSTFESCNVFNQNISQWQTGKVTDMSDMFHWAYKFNQPIGGWDTSNVTSMATMFADATEFNQSLENWNTGKVTSMESMFNSAKAFNQPVDKWDTSKVTEMTDMFAHAEAFNQEIKTWNVGKVVSMPRLLNGADSFNKSLSGWLKGANAVALSDIGSMLPRNYKEPIADWDLRSVTYLDGVVSEEYPCSKLTDIKMSSARTIKELGCAE